MLHVTVSRWPRVFAVSLFVTRTTSPLFGLCAENDRLLSVSKMMRLLNLRDFVFPVCESFNHWIACIQFGFLSPIIKQMLLGTIVSSSFC